MNESTQIPPEAHSRDSRMWGMFCHLSAFAGYVFPFGNIVGPLVIWLLKKDQMPFVDDQGKEALNFQITMTIAAIVSTILIVAMIGAFLLMAVAIANIVFIVVATVQANAGVPYRYPFCLRLIK